MNKDKLEKIVFCVSNDLIHDQRMERICSTVALWGHKVVLIGREMPHSKPLKSKNYLQIRLKSLFKSGKLMYAEFNFRLLLKLLTIKADTYVAIDLDTITPVYLTSIFKKSRRIYDAHELFSELKEVITRPWIHKAWLSLEQFMVPRFPLGMTVSSAIAAEFKRRYDVSYAVVMNTPALQELKEKNRWPRPNATTAEMEGIELLNTLQANREKGVIIYQGAVNEGRCLEWLIPAMKKVDGTLWICGEGNYTNSCKTLIKDHNLEEKVIMMGMLLPEELKKMTTRASIGINLVEPIGLNQIYSLANKFFDYIHAGIPQITMDFPEYRKINDEFEVAVLIEKPEVEIIADALNNLMRNMVLYQRLEINCQRASTELNWHKESEKLNQFFQKIKN